MTENHKTKEDLFCFYVAYGFDFCSSAVKAGYNDPNEGAVLIMKKSVADKIKKFASKLNDIYSSADVGYRKMAFSSRNDAIRLIMALRSSEQDNAIPNPDGLNLDDVSEIKLNKGAIEIKFFDRFAALKGFDEIHSAQQNNPARLFDALLNSRPARDADD